MNSTSADAEPGQIARRRPDRTGHTIGSKPTAFASLDAGDAFRLAIALQPL